MDKIEVTQADRTLYHQLLSLGSVNLNRRRMGLPIVDGFELIAAHRLATRTDATPVAWDDLANAIRMELIFFRDGAVFDAQVKNETDILMQLVRAFVDPPATDVAALVEAAKDALPFMTQLRAGICLKTDGKIVSADSAYQNLYAALAPFTKGQNDE